MILKKLEVLILLFINLEFSEQIICINTKKQTPVNAYRSLLQNYRASLKGPFHSNFTKHPLLQTQPLLTRLNDDTLLKPHLEF